ncbi:MAG: HAMP domain-containing histidine kinase, partial [Anaerolineales bacterium]|nr:HAMP domain-containing histidine kinase [Anaerolineales bacterium]
HQLRSWSNVAVVTELTPDLPSLQCDRNQLVQVLINLLTNARDAMPEGGEITVQTSADAGRLYLRVSDTGAGIPDSIRPKLFDPFFTTKPIGKGTGLGLSIVAGIVRAYGGEISVDSAVGRGTTFSIHFPVTVPTGSGGAYLGEPAPEAQLVGRFDDFSQALPELPGRG